jgi:dienelactone hydrolase
MPDVDVSVEECSYRDGELDLVGVLARPRGVASPRPGVLLVPAVFGITAHARERARMAAALGYVVLAVDMYGGGRSFNSLEEATPNAQTVFGDISALHRRLNAGLQALREHPSVDAECIGAMGFCRGGTAVLELAFAGADLKAVVSFHGGLQLANPAGAAKTAGSVLVCTGGSDPLVPDADLIAFQNHMRESKADWQIHIYGDTLHAFTDPAADSWGLAVAGYNRKADQRSWRAMHALFSERLPLDSRVLKA